MDKSLKSKAISIKGKKYVLVADRVVYFNENYPDGSITTELVSDPESQNVIVKATVSPVGGVENSEYRRAFTGYSQAVIGDGMVNKTAALENAETSAVGRALAMMGIGVIESIASADEINKATGSTGMRYASEKQIKWLRDTALEVNDQLIGTSVAETNANADKWIEEQLTIPPQKIPLFKVKDAIDKLKEPLKSKPVELDLSEEEIEESLDKFKKGELPY